MMMYSSLTQKRQIQFSVVAAALQAKHFLRSRRRDGDAMSHEIMMWFALRCAFCADGKVYFIDCYKFAYNIRCARTAFEIDRRDEVDRFDQSHFKGISLLVEDTINKNSQYVLLVSVTFLWNNCVLSSQGSTQSMRCHECERFGENTTRVVVSRRYL